MKTCLAALVTIGVSGLAGCVDAPSDDDGAGDVPPSPFDDGKEDGFTAPPAAWNWANETLAEFEADGTQYLAWDAPMAKRMQFWADTADAALRKKYGSKLDNIPKPQVFIDTDSVDHFEFGADNALTRQAAVCLSQAVKLAKPGATAMKILGFVNNGTVGPVTDCLTRPAYAAAHKAIIDAFDAGSGECKITDGTSSITYGAKCLYNPEFTGGPKSGTSSAYEATSSYIAFDPDLIKTIADEDEMAYVVFHELGHYYRAHLVLATDYFNYFYSLDKVPAGTKPTPDAKYASLTKSVHETMQSNAINKFQSSFVDEDKRVLTEHLGFYTMEQEADDFSIELLALTNVDPQSAVRALLDLATEFEAMEGVSDGDLTAAQCRTLAAAKWKDGSGKPAYVPVGTIKDIHHSPCFRTWNIAREIAAHGYTADPTKHPAPPGGDWKTLVDGL